MYWFVTPPYLRYAAAGLVVLFALWMDLRPLPTELHWVASTDIPAGTPLTGDLFEVEPIPRGVLTPQPPSGVAAIPISKGDPLLASHVTDISVPDGWWTVRLPVPPGVLPGADLRVVLLSTDPTADPTVLPGLVVRPPESRSTGFGDPEGSVAVPEEAVAAVAEASAAGRVIVTHR